MSCFLSLILTLFSFTAWASAGEDANPMIDMDAIEKQLASAEGLGGRMHSAVSDQGLFVFTWRHPDNFFVNIQLPVATESDAIGDSLKSLKRHDHLVLRGSFIDNDAPVKHILVTEILKIKKWEGLGSNLDYQYQADVPEELLEMTMARFKVHAIAQGGAVVVVEYKDRVFPVFNPNPDLAKALYRNDKIALKFKVQGDPLRPAHLVVDTKRKDPLVRLQEITEGHGEALSLVGPLVMFAKSPQIKFNIFAVKLEDSDGEQRNFTITTDMAQDPQFALFFQILENLQATWDTQLETTEYDRNKFVNRKILIRVSGIKNVVSPSQANPQIFLDDINDLQIEIL